MSRQGAAILRVHDAAHENNARFLAPGTANRFGGKIEGGSGY